MFVLRLDSEMAVGSWTEVFLLSLLLLIGLLAYYCTLLVGRLVLVVVGMDVVIRELLSVGTIDAYARLLGLCWVRVCGLWPLDG